MHDQNNIEPLADPMTVVGSVQTEAASLATSAAVAAATMQLSSTVGSCCDPQGNTALHVAARCG